MSFVLAVVATIMYAAIGFRSSLLCLSTTFEAYRLAGCVVNGESSIRSLFTQKGYSFSYEATHGTIVPGELLRLVVALVL
jgi:hypothetical protein